MITPVILAGGTGSRLWPKSRAKFPKQFLTLTGEHTMLQETLLRLAPLSIDKPIVICNEDHRFLAAEQLRQITDEPYSILLEPLAKNTAPAITLSALIESKNDNDPLLLVLAADHQIKDEQAFHAAVKEGIVLANQGKLVTFGVVPNKPHTGYGYIKTGSAIEGGYQVEAFVEKPNQSLAEEYFETKKYLWNSGMFMFRASRFLSEMKQHARPILDACERAILGKSVDLDFIRIDQEAFSQSPEDSIDYALMEKTESAVVVPLDAQWSDVGDWHSTWEVDERKDKQGNVTIGDVLLQDVNNSYINSEQRLIAMVGVDDLVVVETKDSVLVASKDKVQDIKKIVAKLKQERRPEFEYHREVFRPWGSYDSIDHGRRHQVKRISVKPGEKLSVQMHHHRAEHWIVVSGTAKVTNGDKTFMVTENESTYIPIGVIHALENPGNIPLELIEVQSGSYLGEDDIIRFSDRYGRVQQVVPSEDLEAQNVC